MSLHTTADVNVAPDVVIVGAGPVGLMIANTLGLYGVSVLVVEKLDRIIDYPRAIGLDDESFRAFQSVGLSDALLPHTTPNHWMRFVTGTRCFASIEPRTDEFGWPRRNAFMQPLADQILFDGLARFPRVQVLFGHGVQAFTQDVTGVTVTIAPVGNLDGVPSSTEIRARYLVGCDGGSSFVRRTLDIAFEGRTKPNQWIVIDVRNDPLGTPHIYLHCDVERPYVSAALPHGIRRFEFMVMPGETEEALSQPENLARLMRKVVPHPEKVDYIRQRVYTHNARLASSFRVDRVLLAGDAAHIMPVWQGQGYNSGMRDASNLGWKLAMVVGGVCGDALLETYTAERRDHARAMIHLSEVAGDIFAPQGRLGARLRDGATHLLSAFPSAKRYVVEMRFKPMPRYERGAVLLPTRKRPPSWLARRLARAGTTPLGRLLALMSDKRDSWLGRLVHGRDEFAGNPVGRMFIQPLVRLQSGELVLLDDVIGKNFAVLAWGTNPLFGMSPASRAALDRLGTTFIRIKPEPQMRFEDSIPGVIDVADVGEKLRTWFGGVAASIVLLRPDRFVAATSTPQTLSDVALQLAGCLSLQQGA